MTRTPPTARLFSLLLAIPSAAALSGLAGCASQPTVQAETEPLLVTERSSPGLVEELASLWASPDQIAARMGMQKTGPSLVAGDWLAWQCAAAGGYFDLTPQTFALMIEQN